jgi:hypothetical protein
MRRQRARALGSASVLGAILAVLTNVPPAWYGLPETDAYLFDPAIFSPLWINRVLVPLLSVVATLGLLGGLVGLVARDWPVAGRARRWGGVGGSVALAGFTVAVPAFVYSMQDTGGTLLLPFVGLVVGAASLLLFLPSVVLLSYGYVQTSRPRIGYALAVMPLGVVLLGYLVSGPEQSVAAAIPVGITWALVGQDLLDHHEPLGSPSAAAEG